MSDIDPDTGADLDHVFSENFSMTEREAQLHAEIGRLRKALQKADALADLAYVHGAKAGWNAAHSDNPDERYREITEATQHAALAALKASVQRPKGDE